MQLFFAEKIEGEYAFLSEEEARHTTRVLRKRVGDELHLVDGKGGFYKGILVESGKKTAVVRINEQQLEFGKRAFRLHIALAPTKNIDRFEWFLEKATEIGIDNITPILCEHSERKRIRADRLEKVLMAAMKQSLKAYLPQLQELVRFSDFIKKDHAEFDQKYIAHCAADATKVELKKVFQSNSSCLILIGPEGDFSPKEVELAQNAGFQPISLGESRLRTETAGVVACHTCNLLQS